MRRGTCMYLKSEVAIKVKKKCFELSDLTHRNQAAYSVLNFTGNSKDMCDNKTQAMFYFSLGKV